MSSLERIDSVDPAEEYDYIICGYVLHHMSMLLANMCAVAEHQAV
jgi:hypothetical protein